MSRRHRGFTAVILALVASVVTPALANPVGPVAAAGIQAAVLQARALAVRTAGLTPSASWTMEGHGGFVFAFGSVWHAGGGKVLRIDPATNQTRTSITTGANESFTMMVALGSIHHSIDPAKLAGSMRLSHTAGKVMRAATGSY